MLHGFHIIVQLNLELWVSQSIAKELAKYNITVNVYCPGIADTPVWDQIDKELCQLRNMKSGEPTQKFIDGTLLGR